MSDPNIHQVRCPHCHALQFLSRHEWEEVPIDKATLAIKCWRRTCKRVIGFVQVGGGDQ